jgi:hypothetical protein
MQHYPACQVCGGLAMQPSIAIFVPLLLADAGMTLLREVAAGGD